MFGVLGVSTSEYPDHFAERKDERDTDGRVLWRERATGRLSRTIQLPQAADADAVNATYVNGTLRLTMQKLAVTKTRKISVA
jgi:HSP20 family molecular chaperone IbpA